MNARAAIEKPDAALFAEMIDKFADMPEEEFAVYKENSKKAAGVYNFESLTEQLLNTITE